MNLNVTDIKLKLQEGYTGYLIGIKYVTFETADVVLKSIAKDLRIYTNATGFIVEKDSIFIRLDNNATLCAYYFTDKKVLEEVLERLPEFGKGITNLTKS